MPRHVALLVALVVGAEARATFLDSTLERCPHGHDGGVVILLREDADKGGADTDKKAASTQAGGAVAATAAERYAQKIRGWREAHRSLSDDEQPERRDTVERVFSLIPALTAHLDAATLERVLEDDEVLSVEADCILVAEQSQPGVQLNPPWGLDRTDSCSPACVDDANALDSTYHYGTATGEGALVYVLDTGVRISHDDFGGRAIGGFSVHCPTGNETTCTSAGGKWAYEGIITDQVNSDVGGNGCSSHGTHCAGTVGGGQYGVAKRATIVAVQALSCSGSAPTSDIIAAVEWAVADALARGVPAALSMSLGGPASAASNSAANAAHAAGVVVVVSAGNSYRDACLQSPASAVDALTVGSTAKDDSMSGFSNDGSCVDIFAPGVWSPATSPITSLCACI